MIARAQPKILFHLRLGAAEGAWVFAIYGLVECWFTDIIAPASTWFESWWRLHPAMSALVLLLYPLAGALIGAALGAALFWLGRFGAELDPKRCEKFCTAAASAWLLIFFGLNLLLRYPSSRSAGLLAALAAAGLGAWVLRLASNRPPGWLAWVTSPWLTWMVLVGMGWIVFGGLGRSDSWILKAIACWSYLAILGLSAQLFRWVSKKHQVAEAWWMMALALAGSWCLSALANRSVERPRFPRLANPAPSSASPPVILIVLDTVRADHLSVYGYRRRTTPNLERVARQATVYARGFASGNYTFPSHASMFTGLYPVRFITKPWSDLLVSGFTTLAELLAARGYLTLGVVANAAFLAPETGLNQGFQYFDSRFRRSFWNVPWKSFLLKKSALDLLKHRFRSIPPPKWYRSSQEINAELFYLLDQLRDSKTPFFLFVNFMDTHDPYLPPPPYDRRFPGKNASFSWEADYWPLAEDILSGKREITPTEQAHLISQYDGALAYLDDQLGVLCDRLRQDGWYDRSLLIVTSDLGEAFGEKCILRHGVSLYQSQVNIPLIIKYPNQTSFVEIQSPVNLVDLAPTVLRSLGMELPETLDGLSLFDSEPPSDRFLVAESYTDPIKTGLNRRYVGINRAILSGRFKYMTFRSAPAELYDLVADPRELHDLVGRDEPVGERLNRELADWLRRVQPRAAPMLMEKENRERFEALGY